MNLFGRHILSVEDLPLNASLYGRRENDSDGDDICYNIIEILHTYYIPFIVVIGFVGNSLSAIVFLTTFLKLRSSSYYLAAMSIADFGFIFVVFVVNLSYNNISNIFNTSGFCEGFIYLSQVCAFLSVWVVVAFTVERFIAIKYPLQRPHICTVARAKLVVLGITAIAMVSQLHVFWTSGIIDTGNKLECEMLSEYQDLLRIANYIDMFATLICPVVIIVILNTMIARSLIIFRSKVPMVVETQSDNSTKTKIEELKLTIQNSFDSKLSKSCKENSCESTSSMGVKKTLSGETQHNINKMLLLVSSVFIALNFPSYITRLFAFFYEIFERDNITYLWCPQQFTQLLYYTNFSINFLLYAMGGGTFRHCFCQLIKNIPGKLSSSQSI